MGRITTVKLPLVQRRPKTLLPSPPPAPVRFLEWDSETKSGHTEHTWGPVSLRQPYCRSVCWMMSRSLTPSMHWACSLAPPQCREYLLTSNLLDGGSPCPPSGAHSTRAHSFVGHPASFTLSSPQNEADVSTPEICPTECQHPPCAFWQASLYSGKGSDSNTA